MHLKIIIHGNPCIILFIMMSSWWLSKKKTLEYWIKEKYASFTHHFPSSFFIHISILYTHSGLNKIVAICRQHFVINFLYRKYLYFDSNFTELCSYGFKQQQISISSGNDLVLSRWEAISRTNNDSVHWHIHTFPGFHVLKHWGRDKMAAIFQTTFSNRFSWMKMYDFRLTFHWSLFLGVQLTIFQHWFR